VPKFAYRAVNADGETIDGLMDAPDKSDVIVRLQRGGLVLIRAEEASESPPPPVQLFGRGGLTKAHLATFTRQVATLLRAGLPLDRALRIAETTLAREADRRIVRRLLERVEGGKSLADAMSASEDSFPGFYIGMVRAGEAGASLESVMERLAGFIEHSEASRQKIQSALLYPAIVVIASVISVGILFAVVVPEFTPMFAESGHALPFMTEMVVAVSDAVAAWWWAGLLALGAMIGVGFIQARNPAVRSRWDRLILRMPVFGGLVRKIETARFSRTLGTLLHNGVPILQSLDIARLGVANRHLAASLPGAIESVKQGRDLGPPLARTGMFPDLAVQLVRVGDETGKPDDMLLKIAEIYDQETERTIGRMLTMLGPAITVVLGVIIATVIGSILTAILSVYDLAS